MISPELTNVKVGRKTNSKNPWGNAVWRKNYIMQEQDAKKWAADRILRLQTAQSYVVSNMVPFQPPNQYVLDMRLVKQNNIWDAQQKFDRKTDYIHRFSYYDPVEEGPPPKRKLYSGNNFFMNLT